MLNMIYFIRPCKKYLFFACFIGIIMLAGCSLAPIMGGLVENDKLVDGIYEGRYSKWPNTAVVKVTIQDRKIIKIEILKNTGSWKAKKAVPLVPDRIIAKQSTDVDAVSGATNSSRVIMNAVQMALDKARLGPQ